MIECSIYFVVNKKHKLNFNKGDYDGLNNFIQTEFQSTKENCILDTKNCVEMQWQFVKYSLNIDIEKYIPVTEYPLINSHHGSNHYPWIHVN